MDPVVNSRVAQHVNFSGSQFPLFAYFTPLIIIRLVSYQANSSAGFLGPVKRSTCNLLHLNCIQCTNRAKCSTQNLRMVVYVSSCGGLDQKDVAGTLESILGNAQWLKRVATWPLIWKMQAERGLIKQAAQFAPWIGRRRTIFTIATNYGN